MKMKFILGLLLVFVSLMVVSGAGKKGPVKPVGLIPNFYKTTRCPQAEQLVKQITQEKTRKDPTLGAKLLRVHYHDCFVRVCCYLLIIYICTNLRFYSQICYMHVFVFIIDLD